MQNANWISVSTLSPVHLFRCSLASAVCRHLVLHPPSEVDHAAVCSTAPGSKPSTLHSLCLQRCSGGDWRSLVTLEQSRLQDCRDTSLGEICSVCREATSRHCRLDWVDAPDQTPKAFIVTGSIHPLPKTRSTLKQISSHQPPWTFLIP